MSFELQDMGETLRKLLIVIDGEKFLRQEIFFFLDVTQEIGAIGKIIRKF